MVYFDSRVHSKLGSEGAKLARDYRRRRSGSSPSPHTLQSSPMPASLFASSDCLDAHSGSRAREVPRPRPSATPPALLFPPDELSGFLEPCYSDMRTWGRWSWRRGKAVEAVGTVRRQGCGAELGGASLTSFCNWPRYLSTAPSPSPPFSSACAAGP